MLAVGELKGLSLVSIKPQVSVEYMFLKLRKLRNESPGFGSRPPLLRRGKEKEVKSRNKTSEYSSRKRFIDKHATRDPVRVLISVPL